MNRSRKENIMDLKQQLNTPSQNSIKAFTRYKLATYVCNIVVPPYGLYRLWSRQSEFCLSEKIAQTFVVSVYVTTLIQSLI
ncbi:MAG: hypothetical protein PHI41_03670 [Erysipelotrichaceae bacterium]|nr:hypothetical protein [Erysipelotrichaceae bacterium]MDD3809836.1 hypothetical protein [Erysipelotrichaceae bacterium]